MAAQRAVRPGSGVLCLMSLENCGHCFAADKRLLAVLVLLFILPFLFHAARGKCFRNRLKEALAAGGGCCDARLRLNLLDDGFCIKMEPL